MTRNKVFAVLLCLAAVLFFSCKSTPEPEEPKPAPVTPAQPEKQPEKIPETPKVDLSEENAALAAQVSQAKEDAIAAGAKDFYASELDSVSAAYDAAKKAYDEGGDQSVFNTAAKDALDKYNAISLASKAQNMLADIEKNDFAKYSEGKYNSGKDSLAKVKELLASGASGSEILASAQSAYDDIFAVYSAGYAAWIAEKKSAYSEAKKKADDLKASKADKEGYAQAVEQHTASERDFLQGKFFSAYQGYTASVISMNAVYERVLEKRRKAEEAIAKAKEKATKIEQFAAEADEIAPLPDTPENQEVPEGADNAASEAEVKE
jgi:hypothetical protein